MSNAMTVRFSNNPADAPQLAQIQAECFDDVWSANDIAELLVTPGTFACIAESDLGFILVRVAGDESEVLTVAVRPAARRRGIASRLVMHALNQAAELGATIMFLEVSVANLPAIQLYTRHGFIEVGTRKAYYQAADGTHQDARVMRKEIQPHRVGNPMQLG